MKKTLNLTKDERIDDLQFEGLKLVQNKNLYAFTSDAVILANFLKIKRGEKAVEIGSGSGVISILATKKTNASSILGFEIQKPLFDMANKSLSLNNIQNVKFVNDDVKNFKKYIPVGYADVVFSNPPYKKQGESEKNENVSKLVARHEENLRLNELCFVASQILKFGGRAYFVYDASRSSEMICELCRCGLETKRMFFTENGKGKVILFVVEAVKGAKSGVTVLPNIVTNDSDGKYIQQLNALHNPAKQTPHNRSKN